MSDVEMVIPERPVFTPNEEFGTMAEILDELNEEVRMREERLRAERRNTNE